MFKEILLLLWSRSVFPTLFLLCFLFYLLTVCELGGKQAGVEQDTCPIYTIYCVLYLWTWEVSRREAFVPCKIWVYPLPLCQNTLVAFDEELLFKQMPQEQSFDVIAGIYQTQLCEGSTTQLRLVCLDKYVGCHSGTKTRLLQSIDLWQNASCLYSHLWEPATRANDDNTEWKTFSTDVRRQADPPVFRDEKLQHTLCCDRLMRN